MAVYRASGWEYPAAVPQRKIFQFSSIPFYAKKIQSDCEANFAA
jgi:hypothetical protein